MTALFGSVLSDSKYLVQFRTGKMHLRGTTVTADKRKGLLYIYQSDDSLMHLCWMDRTSGAVEDDLIIFPDDAEFKQVPQCTTGRAYLLKFKSSSRKFFFWMQEPKPDKDEEYCKKVNDLLNNPPAPNTGVGGNSLSALQPALASLGDQLGDSSLQRMLSSMDQNQLMQILGMSGLGGGSDFGRREERVASSSARSSNLSATAVTSRASAAVPAEPRRTESQPSAPKSGESRGDVPPAAPSRAAVQLSDLQSILSSMQMPTLPSPQPPHQNVDLATSFTSEALLPLLSDPKVQERLAPFLPEVKDLPRGGDELRATIQSPQFKQALSSFSAALQSGQLASLMQQFKVNKEAISAAAAGDIIGFVKSLQEKESAATGGQQADEDMALD